MKKNRPFEGLFFFALYGKISPMQALSVQNITFKYPHAETEAVNDVSFQIEKGSYTVIAGHNGSGKSTLARILSGLETPDSGSVTVGQGLKIGMVFQNPKNQIISGIISRDTAIGPQNEGLSKAETELRVIESLNITGMLDRSENPTLSLSLGQTQKVALAGIIALRPEILVLDEAMAMLDAESRQDIYNFLDYWHQNGNTILHITHDEDAVRRAQNVIAMKEGRIVFTGKVSDFTPEGHNLVPELIKNHKHKTSADSSDNTPALVFNKVSFSYNEKSKVSDLSFSIPKGKITALTGPSGSGKSTILELMSGLLSPENGKILKSGTTALCQQNAQGALFEAFAADDVAFGPRNQGKSGKDLVKLVKKSMTQASIPYEKFGERRSFELSGGEQRRLAIAGIIALESDIVLFDEPTAGLDEPSRAEILSLLETLCEEGKTVVFSTHRKDEADFADHLVHIVNGKQAVPETPDSEGLSETEILSSAETLASLRKVSEGFSHKTEKNSLLSKMHPAIRILLFLAVFAANLAARSLLFTCIMTAIGFIYCLFARFPAKKLFVAALKLIPFLALFSIFQIMFLPAKAGETLYTSWRFFTISPSKIFFCVCTIVRTLGAVAEISGFYYSTPEYDLLDGLALLLKPLALIRIPVRYFILVIEIMFRFIPLLVDEAASIIKTQSIRGGLKQVKGKLAKVRAMLPLFVPLIAQTVKRAEALADALTIRSFR